MKKRKCNQLDIFHVDHVHPVRKTYLSLGINEKINVKANSQGFAFNHLRTCMNCWKNYIGNIQNSDHPEKLTYKWFLFIKHNHGRMKIVSNQTVLNLK